MARLQGIREQDAGVIGRYLINAVRRASGKLTETWPIVARVPNVQRAWAAAEFFFDKLDMNDKRLRSLVSLKTSLLIGCPA